MGNRGDGFAAVEEPYGTRAPFAWVVWTKGVRQRPVAQERG
jgi:hypothetical protein